MNNSGLKVRVAISSEFFTALSIIPRENQNKIIDFVNKFRSDPMSPGINYEDIINVHDNNLKTAIIDETYSAIILNPSKSNVYLLLWIDIHDNAYDWARKKRCLINTHTGCIQIFDVNEEELNNEGNGVEKLFDEIKDEDLFKLGTPKEIISTIRSLNDIEELEDKMQYIPLDVYEALYFLASGYSIEEVIKEYGEDKSINEDDYAAALDSVSTLHKFIVLDDEENEQELKEILNAPLDKWRVFLHPSQRKIVEKNFNGPARVLGGAGTGKTVVAMHRAKWLLENVYTDKDDKILFTTFTKNLAEDITENLKKICSPDLMKKIDVVNIDSWVFNFLKQNRYDYRIIYGRSLEVMWEKACYVASSELTLSTSFYVDEWEKVIVPNSIFTKEEYLKVPRIGRGTRLDRKMRSLVWEVFEEFRAIMNEEKVRDIDSAMMEARIILEDMGDALPYKSIIVDEAQDLGIQAFKLIRQIAGEEHKNDIFIVGDSHQRIYRKQVVLSKCGINVRGRGNRLKINYRTSEETRNWAFKLLEGLKFDDLDAGVDEDKGYKSLIHGPKPEVNKFSTINEEANFICMKTKKLAECGVNINDICIVVRTDNQLEMYSEFIKAQGLQIYKLKRKNADDRNSNGVRIATMHRVKGLEFEYVFLVGINEGTVPFNSLLENSYDNVVQKEILKSERALVYVAATRAKKKVFVSSYNKQSSFLNN